ncbi:hypothetical protein FQZ97_1044400 [compost metagenome]
MTVTRLSRSWSTQRLAENLLRVTKRAPATSVGYAAMNWALPWNRGVTDIHASSGVNRTSDTHSSAKKYICACGIATPLLGPVVPEVKSTEARSWGRTSGSASVAPTTSGAVAASSSSSNGAASQPAARRVASAWSREPVSMTQNLRIDLAASAIATKRAA